MPAGGPAGCLCKTTLMASIALVHVTRSKLMPKKLKFGPDEGINYDQPPAYFGGFTILTYGNYGGPGYTAGEYGSASGSTVREFVPANFVANVNAKGRGYQDDIDLVPGNIYNYTATV